jgi:hypothetical protein
MTEYVILQLKKYNFMHFYYNKKSVNNVRILYRISNPFIRHADITKLSANIQNNIKTKHNLVTAATLRVRIAFEYRMWTARLWLFKPT